MPELTDRERELLHLVATAVLFTGCQPSYREIARHFGWASAGYVTVLVHSLQKKGVVVRAGSRAIAFDWKNYLTLKEEDREGQKQDGGRADGTRRRHVSKGNRGRVDERRDRGLDGTHRRERRARQPVRSRRSS